MYPECTEQQSCGSMIHSEDIEDLWRLVHDPLDHVVSSVARVLEVALATPLALAFLTFALWWHRRLASVGGTSSIGVV